MPTVMTPVVPSVYLPKYVSLLVYGPADSGKTYFASGVPSNHKSDDVAYIEGVLFGDIDGGMATLASAGIVVDRWPPNAQKRITTWADIKAMFDHVQKNKGRYKVVVLDTLTRFQEEVKDAFMREGNSDKMQTQDWGRLLTHMTRVAKQSPDWGCHVVVTAHPRMQTDANDGQEKLMPSFQGQFGDMAASFFDVMAYYKVVYDKTGQPIRRMYFKPQRGFLARTRLPLPEYMDNPSLPDVLSRYATRREESIQKLKQMNPNIQIQEVQGEGT